MNFSPAIDSRPKAPGLTMLLLAAVAVGLAFFLTEHDHSRSLAELVDPDGSNEERSASEGTLQREVGFVILPVVGLCGMLAARRKTVCFRGFLAFAQLFCLLWCVASIAWSAEVSLTIRRIGILLCFSMGALGLGRCFTLRQLCIICITVAGAYVVIGLVDEILQGAFQPAASEYRFTGHVHPNLQASYCAAICLGSLCLIGRSGPMRFVLAAVAVLAFVFLVLTKSRTATMALVAGCAMIAIHRLSMRRALALGLATGWILSVVVLAASIVGIDPERSVLQTVLIGRTDDAMSLTGRVPLWNQLLATANDRILTGFGVGAFWTPQHIHLASAVVGAGVTHAHSAYIEALLNVGILGLVGYLLMAAAAVRVVVRRCRIDPEAGILFLAALMAFGFVHAFAEALFVSSSFVPFFAAAGLSHAAFFSEEDPTQQDRPATPGEIAPAAEHGSPAGSSSP